MNTYAVRRKRKVKKDKSLNLDRNKTEKKERNRTSNDPLTKEECETLLKGIDNIQDYTLLFLGLYTGMRVSEIGSIEDISLREDEGKIHIWDEKKNIYRDVFVPEEVFSGIKRYLNSIKKRKDPRIFPVSTKTIERRIQFWTKKILGKQKSWHTIRHSYISLSRELYIPMEIVIQNTGDTPSTILKYYSRPSSEFIRKTVNERKIYEVR